MITNTEPLRKRIISLDKLITDSKKLKFNTKLITRYTKQRDGLKEIERTQRLKAKILKEVVPTITCSA